jgi:hypothetical protein
MIFLILFAVIFVICVAHDVRKAEIACKATFAECDASEAFTDWRLRNPGVYIGLSEEGRKILGVYLDAYDEFLRTHPYVDGTKHREWLVSLFYEFPPKSPKDMPTQTKKRLILRRFFYYQQIKRSFKMLIVVPRCPLDIFYLATVTASFQLR